MTQNIQINFKLSPSKIQYIFDCKLRYVKGIRNFSGSAKKIFNINSFFGILLHSLLEDFINSRFNIDDYNIKWDKALKKISLDYNVDFEGFNLKYHLPYYYIKKGKMKEYFPTRSWQHIFHKQTPPRSSR